MTTVIKATGEKEPFSEEKLRRSVKRAGIPDELQDQVVAHINEKLYENIPTSEIYHHITEFLGKSPHPFTKSKYSLKQAIMALGPTGYPFEDFISLILQEIGYKTQLRTILLGKCVSHEIDVIAEKDRKRNVIEAKFHNLPGTKTGIHVALYTKARFDDLAEKYTFNEVWIITNTKVTSDAIVYANCVGIKILSWSHPEEGNLRDLIEKSHLFPITTLTTLSPIHKQQLFQENVVLSKQICKNPNLLNILKLPNDQKDKVLAEVDFVCNT